MRIRLTVWTGSTAPAPRQVTITVPDESCPEGRHASAIARQVATTLGTTGDAFSVRGRLVDDDALLGHPPLLDGASVRLVIRAEFRTPRRRPSMAATELAVIGGPDAGAVRALTAGSHTVGRAGADVTLADPTLSRVHLRIDVGADGVAIVDLGSENGTGVDGELLTTPTMLAPGMRVTVGQSTLTVRPSRVRPATTTAPGDGTLLVSRSPRLLPSPPAVRIDVPRPPDRPDRRRPPWLAALIPFPIAGLLAWFFGPHLLLLAVMSPIMLIGTYVSDRIGAGRTYARALAEHTLTLEECERQQASALAAERSWRERTYPDLAMIARLARTPGAGLWSRIAADGVVLRLGTGGVPSAITRREDGRDSTVHAPQMPVPINLATVGSLALGGPLAAPLTDALIGQLVTLHSPQDLHVWTDRDAWAHVPHVRTASTDEVLREALAEVRRRETADGSAGVRPTVVVSCDSTGLDSDEMSVLDTVVHSGPALRVLVIVRGSGGAGAAAQLLTTRTGAAVLTDRDGGTTRLVIDTANPDWSHRVAAALTPLREAGASAAELPTALSLTGVMESAGRATSPAGIAAQWTRADDGAWATLGVASDAPYRIDLAAAGPHALVGGTTGSGKSELLRSLIVALAAEHPPDELAVILVDYKGGSAFTGLEPLPHIVGVVTDLDPAATTRALESLRAEIHRREELFAGCGATDLPSYRQQRRRGNQDLPQLARLVLVVDEFRALADELPDFVTGLVRIAAVGRSLGIHLVLATQRPAGVVTADMRANLGLRIALRVRDRTDSQDVIESDAAALLPLTCPGRAILRCGAEPLTTIQTGLLTETAVPARITISAAWSDGTNTDRTFSVARDQDPADLVANIAAAAATTGRTPPISPWLPPLPTDIAWHEGLPVGAWAMEDDPARQQQGPVSIDLASWPHTAIAGGIRSGRTTTAVTLTSAALAGSGADTHLYVLGDPTGPLAKAAGLPHTGAVIDRTDPTTIAWFTDRLSAEVRSRAGQPPSTLLLVVIDGWDVLADTCDALDHGALTDRLLATLREGYAVGVRAIVTGDRSVLVGRVARTLPHRLLLRPADPADLALAGLPPRTQPLDPWPPGRLLRVDDGRTLQALRRPLTSHHVPRGRPPARAPWRVSPLPRQLLLDTLAWPSAAAVAAGTVTIGLRADGEVAGLGGPGQRRVVVLGSPGSGRSTALAAITHQAARAGRRVAVISDPHTELAKATEHLSSTVDHLTWQDDDRLVTLRTDHPDLTVVADDVDRHLDSPLVPVLEQIADLVERDGGLIAVTGDGATIGLRTRGVGAAVARGRTGLVLGASSPLDGDVLGVRLPKVNSVIPGRGWLVMNRSSTPIQIGIPMTDVMSRS